MIGPTGRTGRRCLAVCLGVAALSAAVSGTGLLGQAAAPPQPPAPSSQNQKPPAPPVFQGGVNFVYVDVYPRRDGRVLEGLRAEDFQVSEDGKPQKVETFQFIRNDINPVDADRRDPTSKEDGDRQAADPKNRVFVVYLDVFHVDRGGSNDARRPILDFLERTIGANDLFGVMTPELPVSDLVFGRNTTGLEDELTRNWPWGEMNAIVRPRSASEQSILDNCSSSLGFGVAEQLVLLHREDVLASSLENLMAKLGGLRDERKSVLFISEGWTPRPPQGQLRNLVGGRPPTVGVGPGGKLGIGTDMGRSPNGSSCDSELSRLAGIDFEQRFRDLLGLAQRANVAFYPVDVGGLRTTVPTSDVLLTLAENTGGIAIVNTNDVRTGMRRVADDLSAYYLLGYYSTNAAFDGRFRRIDVKVTQPRVSVSARKGYMAPTADVRRAMETPAVKAGPTPVDDAVGRLARLDDAADVYGYGVSAATGLDLVAEIATKRIDQGRWRSGAKVQFTAKSAGGTTLSGSGTIDAARRGALVHIPLDHAEPGPWRVSVRLSSSGDTAEETFDVANGAGRLLGDPLVFRGTAAPRAPLQPVADLEFRRTERLHVEWPALMAIDQRTVRVLDRRGQSLAIGATASERPSDTAPAIVADVSLAPLAEGDYVIEMTAGSGAETEHRLLAFRIVR